MVQKDIEKKQGAIITEKAVKEDANRMLKWLEATKGKLKHSTLDHKSGQLENDLKNAEVCSLNFSFFRIIKFELGVDLLNAEILLVRVGLREARMYNLLNHCIQNCVLSRMCSFKDVA